MIPASTPVWYLVAVFIVSPLLAFGAAFFAYSANHWIERGCAALVFYVVTLFAALDYGLKLAQWMWG